MNSQKKKIIIIEGPDNVGKDTLINKLKETFKNPIVFHAGIPDNNKSLHKFYYEGIIHDTLDKYYNSDCDAIIHNRSFYGEFVYGPKYRNMFPGTAAQLVYDLEAGQLRTFIREDELYLILLTSDNVNLLINNEDGKSLSLADKKNISDEIELFNTIFKLSEIKNKKKVLVNNDASFKDKDEIYNEVITFINK